MSSTTQSSNRVSAVVVDYHAGEILRDCLESLRSEGVAHIVVVENGDPEPARTLAKDAGALFVTTGVNLGFGAGVNRGVAASAPGDSEFVLVANPDLFVHKGAIGALVGALDAHSEWGMVGPRILGKGGSIYPSARSFPRPLLAAGHALVSPLWPTNPLTRRYRPHPPDKASVAGWVSGACFLIRRATFEEVGGFDETYFMFAEDMDLCWRLGERGIKVGIEPAAVITHLEGVSRARHPSAMLRAHHRSALHFAARTQRGWRRPIVAVAAVVLGVRLVLSGVVNAEGKKST